MAGRDDVKMEIEKGQNDVFMFREPIVLITIICLSLSKGITFVVQGEKLSEGYSSRLLLLWNLSLSVVPMVGMVFFTFLSELHGRKPVFITLCILSIISAILHLLPWQESATFSFPWHGFVKGGLLVMNTLAITEYCSPKHRFTYLMCNAMMFNTVYLLTSIVITLEARVYPYVQAFQIVLMLACLVSACKWPESPYWLASQGRLEDSRVAFLWLRGEEGRKECNTVMVERRSPGPFKLYWLSFFVAIATISVDIFTDVGSRFWQRWVVFHLKDNKMIENIIRACTSIVVAFLLSVASYFVKRKTLFLMVSGISFLLSYAISIWMRVDQTVEGPDNQVFYYAFFVCNLISSYGPGTLGIILGIELIPLKYNSHMTCAGFLCIHIVYFPFMTFFSQSLSSFERSHVYLPLFTTLSLVGVIAYCCFAPDTKDKNLSEIQKMYTPELIETNSKEDHVIMTHI